MYDTNKTVLGLLDIFLHVWEPGQSVTAIRVRWLFIFQLLVFSCAPYVENEMGD